MAELADAPGLGPGPSGCRFNSCRAHHFPEPIYMGSGDLLRRFIAIMNNYSQFFNLGNISKEEKEALKTNHIYKKKVNDIIKESRAKTKLSYCYYCEKEVTSFCKSHSIPSSILKNIAHNGKVLTLNSLIDNPLLDDQKGVNDAGTFKIICRECDSSIFSDYENPNNYTAKPTQKMLSQIALKNNLIAISKRKTEMQMRDLETEIRPDMSSFLGYKNMVSKLDLNEFEKGFQKAKKAINKNSTNDYYLCYYKKLDYVVPLAFQSYVALLCDFEGNTINDIYNYSSDYDIKYINICIFPFENESVIFMFIENGDKRYRSFYKQFNKLPLDEQLAALTFIIFAYSEEVYLSNSIISVIKDKQLCDIGKQTTEVFAFDYNKSPLGEAKQAHDLNKRNEIPNLLSYQYKLR